MSDEKLTPERAIRLLRAKAGELETLAKPLLVVYDLSGVPPTAEQSQALAFGYLTADIALIASLLADYMEHNEAAVAKAAKTAGKPSWRQRSDFGVVPKEPNDE